MPIILSSDDGKRKRVMTDFTVLHGDELDKVRKLEGFYMAVQGLVETTELFSENVSLSYLKVLLRDYNPDSN